MTTVYLVADVPGHKTGQHNCALSPPFCDPISIFTNERKAWDVCMAFGSHSIGYNVVQLDREYAPGDKVQTVFPNCPCNCHPEPKSAEALEMAAAG